MQDVFPGEYELSLRMAKQGAGFGVNVTAQGVSVGQSSMQSAGSLEWPQRMWRGGEGRDEWVWKQVGLGKVVITGNIQDCLVTLKNIDTTLKADWALDFLELKRIVGA